MEDLDDHDLTMSYISIMLFCLCIMKIHDLEIIVNPGHALRSAHLECSELLCNYDCFVT